MEQIIKLVVCFLFKNIVIDWNLIMDIFLCIIILGFAIFEAFQYRKQGSDACGVVDIPRFKRNCTADFAGLVTAIIYAIMIEHKISIGAIVPVAAIFGLVAYQAADDEETIDFLERFSGAILFVAISAPIFFFIAYGLALLWNYREYKNGEDDKQHIEKCIRNSIELVEIVLGWALLLLTHPSVFTIPYAAILCVFNLILPQINGHIKKIIADRLI